MCSAKDFSYWSQLCLFDELLCLGGDYQSNVS